jgi:glyoxylase-like metal-dependent hydrolase (beta-lactamase superfamily II)
VQIGEGVHRLTPGVCNFYLIEDGGKLVLVDAGAPRDWDLLVQTLPALGRRLEDLEAVLITHAQSDHTCRRTGLDPPGRRRRGQGC